jgi:hypothetical protein
MRKSRKTFRPFEPIRLQLEVLPRKMQEPTDLNYYDPEMEINRLFSEITAT